MKKIVAVLLIGFALPALAQEAAAPAAPAVHQQINIQQLLGNLTPKQQMKLQQGMVTAMLMGCVSQKTDQAHAQAFFTEMQQTGKQVHDYCKTGQDAMARDLVLTSIDKQHNDPIVGTVHQCYLQHTADIATLGPQQADDAIRYDRWIQNPQLARAEMKDEDVCHQKGGIQ